MTLLFAQPIQCDVKSKHVAIFRRIINRETGEVLPRLYISARDIAPHLGYTNKASVTELARKTRLRKHEHVFAFDRNKHNSTSMHGSICSFFTVDAICKIAKNGKRASQFIDKIYKDLCEVENEILEKLEKESAETEKLEAQKQMEAEIAQKIKMLQEKIENMQETIKILEKVKIIEEKDGSKYIAISV